MSDTADTVEIARAEYERLLAVAAGDGPALDINGFCAAEQMSRAMYFKMQAEGWGPREYYVGELVRISPTAHREWRCQRAEAAAAGIGRGLPNNTSNNEAA